MPCGLACSIAAELGIEYTAGSCVKCRKLDVAALRFETLSGAEVKRSGWYGRAEYLSLIHIFFPGLFPGL